MLYSVVLFVHVLATVVLTSSLTVEAVALGRMRRARTVSEAKLWMDPVPALPIVVGASVLVLLISGGYLAAKMMAWSLG